MSLYIPRLEWNEISVTGTRTSGNPTISSISSTAAITVGMIASGTGVPTDATVISKTVNSVTLSANATLSGTSSVIFFERIDFDYPPVSDTEEQLKPKQTITESLSGEQQTVTDFLEATRTIRMNFITKTILEKLRDNFFIYAYVGNSFKYYEDKALVGFKTYTLEKRTFQSERTVKKHPNFLYSVGFQFRRVI